jgi:hypothetical protein
MCSHWGVLRKDGWHYGDTVGELRYEIGAVTMDDRVTDFRGKQCVCSVNFEATAKAHGMVYERPQWDFVDDEEDDPKAARPWDTHMLRPAKAGE